MHNLVPEALEQLYIRGIFDGERRKLALKIGASVHQALEKAMDQSEWMDKGSKRRVQEKLDALSFNVGHPDDFLDEGCAEERVLT